MLRIQASGRSRRPRKPRAFKCRRLRRMVDVAARQRLIPGWDQDACSRQAVLVAGGGGLGGEVVEGLVRKGNGEVRVSDKDTVEVPDLGRQKFIVRSLFKNKALELCRIMRGQGFLGSRLKAYPDWFQDLPPEALSGVSLVFCCVDNKFPDTRLAIARRCHQQGIPCVFLAVSRDAGSGYCFVQVPDRACWACWYRPEDKHAPDEDEQRECPGQPACIDILKTIAGLGLYAADTLCMSRPIDWNFRFLSLGAGESAIGQMIERRPDCPVCGDSECNSGSD